MIRGARAVHTRCVYWGFRFGVLGFRRPTHLLDSEVHVFLRCTRNYHRTYCTVSPYNLTHVSFMASCGHHCHLHVAGCLPASSPPPSVGPRNPGMTVSP